jgi:hypothetical protein
MGFGRHDLHIEIVDVHAANVLQTLELPPQAIQRMRLMSIQADLSQLIYGGCCLLSWIHESNNSYSKLYRQPRGYRYLWHRAA